MRTILILCSFFLPLSAHAIQVKNLSENTQMVALERSPGSVDYKTIPPGESVLFSGRGMMRLADKPVQGNVSHGLLGGLFSPHARGVEALRKDYFVIWDNGVLSRQMRRRAGGR